MIWTMRRIPKELLPQFLCDLQGRENSDHIEARYCILHRLYPASRFDWDDITIIKPGQDFSRNKTLKGIHLKWVMMEDLFCAHAFRPPSHVPCELEALAQSMAEKCQGFPLALNVIGRAMKRNSAQSRRGKDSNNPQWEKRLTPTRGVTPLTWELWQVFCSLSFSYLWSQHCEGSLKNSCHSFCVTLRDWKKLPAKLWTLIT
jgi:hypothetical protein